MSAIDSSKTLAAMLQLQAARTRGEKVSEFTSARTHAEFFLNQFIDALNSGVSYSETVSCLSVSAECSRHTAYDILGKVLRKAGYIRPEEVVQRTELKPIELIEPVIPVAEKPKPIQKTKPVPVPPIAEISDPAKYMEKEQKSGVVQEGKAPGKWDHLRGDVVLGPGRFMGEEHRWASPETLQKEKDDLAYLREMSEAEDKRREERKKAKVLKELQQETQIQSDKE